MTPPLFGREVDLDNVRALFDHGERLVTLVGSPGIGKTRVAEAIASIEAPHVVHVDLGKARSAGEVTVLVGNALGIARTGDEDVDAQRVTKAIAARDEDLVVLDTFEHLIPFAASTVGRWIESSATGRFLITSREGLALPIERIYELGPIDEHSAVMLLADRARRAGWAPSTDSEAVLATIAHRLDGVPLALELAAHRIAILGEHIVSARLSELSSDTLRREIAWSWALLDPGEQNALAQLSVFPGDLSLEAAEAVVQVPGRATLDLVQSLRAKSLIAPSTADGRFRLFLSIRSFAREHLHDDAALDRHASYYLSLAESLALGGRKSNARAALECLERERENLQAILDRPGAHRLRAVFALAPLAMARGPVAPLLEAVDALLADEAEPSRENELLELRARALRRIGRIEESLVAYDAVLAREVPASKRAAHVLGEIAWTAFSSGQLAEAIGYWQRARDTRRLVPPVDDRAEGVDLVRMALALRELGEHDRASVLAVQALSTGRRSHDAGEEAMATAMLAVLASDRGAFERAFDLAKRAVERCRGEGSVFFEGYALGSLSITHQTTGNLDAAEKITRGIRQTLASIGSVRLDAIALVHLGWIAWERRQLRDAWNHFDDARSGFEALRDMRNCVLATACLAAVEANEGETATAKERHATMSDGTPLTRTLDVLALHLDRSRAHERLASMGPPSSYEERIVRRILLQSLADAHAPSAAQRPTITLSSTNVACSLGEVALPIGRRAAARNVLATLVRARLACPNEPAPWRDLVASAWPGERITDASAKNRVKVTIAWLRKLGLRDAIESDERGYWLGDRCDVTGG